MFNKARTAPIDPLHSAGGLHLIRKKAGLFFSTCSSVRLWWEFKKDGPQGPDRSSWSWFDAKKRALSLYRGAAPGVPPVSCCTFPGDGGLRPCLHSDTTCRLRCDLSLGATQSHIWWGCIRACGGRVGSYEVRDSQGFHPGSPSSFASRRMFKPPEWERNCAL